MRSFLLAVLASIQDTAADPVRADERVTSSAAAWGIAAVLMVVAAYFLIRLLEWDLVNKETPDQDDPLP